VRERDRQRHELRGLVDREAEHHSLVAGAELGAIVARVVHALGDVR